MFKEKLLALLTQKFAGVRKDGLNNLAASLALTVSTDEEAEQVVGKLTADTVNQYVTDWRKEVDAENNKASQTREANLRAKYNFVDKQEHQDPNPQDPPKPNPSPHGGGGLNPEDIQKLIVNSVKEATQGLQNEIQSLKGSAVTANRREALLKVFNDQTPQPFKDTVLETFELRTFEDDEAFAEFANKTKENVAALTQEIADKGLGGHTPPIFGKPNSSGVSSGVLDYIEAKKAEANGEAPLGGKKLF